MIIRTNFGRYRTQLEETERIDLMNCDYEKIKEYKICLLHFEQKLNIKF